MKFLKIRRVKAVSGHDFLVIVVFGVGKGGLESKCRRWVGDRMRGLSLNAGITVDTGVGEMGLEMIIKLTILFLYKEFIPSRRDRMSQSSPYLKICLRI